MKKTVIALLIVVAVASVSFADEGETQKKASRDAILRTAEVDYLIGKVTDIVPTDLLTRTRSKISVMDEKNNEVEFVVRPLAVVYDTAGKIMALGQVRSGQEVQVNYKTTKGNVKEATAIKVIK